MELKLKQFRTGLNLSQERLAEMVKTTQQTIQRWETGKSEPPLAALRDLATIFGTSIDDLLGRNPLSKEASTNHLFSLDSGHGNFWGNLGLQFPGDKLSRWYPVTTAEATRVEERMNNLTEESPWLVVATLNNRMLIVNGLAVKQVSLLDEAADQPDDDWELPWDGMAGLEPEVYRALVTWAGRGDEEELEASDAFKEGLKNTIEEHKLTPELVKERVLSTLIRYKDGSEQSYEVEPGHLWHAVLDAESASGEPVLFDLTDYGEGRNVYVPGAALSLLDMPLHVVIDAAKASDEYGADDDGHEKAPD
jgi:transcriptional regulator with XRE-family HTH domain